MEADEQHGHTGEVLRVADRGLHEDRVDEPPGSLLRARAGADVRRISHSASSVSARKSITLTPCSRATSGMKKLEAAHVLVAAVGPAARHDRCR